MGNSIAKATGYHLLDYADLAVADKTIATRATKYIVTQNRQVNYRVTLHQHPYVQQLMQRLLRKGVGGLQAADTDYLKNPDGSFQTLPDGKFKPNLYSEFFDAYKPNAEVIRKPYPVEDLDFTSSGAYAVYNWELFFHVPITIAMHLSKNQRFADAQRWFHFLFDPTDDSDGPTPERFWKVRPFQYTDVKKIEQILVNLATNQDQDLRNETLRSIEAWKDKPFRPHVIARYRQQAYMYKTVMAYLDNLIAWGDSLFRQDTGEAIDEALMLYVLAANILGPRPQAVPKKGNIRPQTYANLRQDLRQFGVVMRQVESSMPLDLAPYPMTTPTDSVPLATIRSLGKALYFGVPRNDKLLGYWDTVADRLFKIRNSLNFQGVFRQLALFEPPIDPGMLARAAAAGLDVGAIINGLNQPLPLVRFQVLVQKAMEITQEVKSLGNNLLSAIEKEDGEAMALLRAKHEQVMLEMAERVRYGQWQEAIKAKEGVIKSLASAVQRYTYYERLLGRQADEILKAIPDIGELDRSGLEKMKLALKEAELARREIEVDIAQDLGASGGKLVSSFEQEELSKAQDAHAIQSTLKTLNLVAQGLSLIPDFGIDIHFWGLGGNSDISGGSKLSQFARFAANIASAVADNLSYESGQAAKMGSYAHREQDWAYQSNLAAAEINQVFKQLRAAQIREAVAELELKNHRQQMKHADELQQFMNEDGSNRAGKQSNRALYAWMKREVRGLYSQCFQFAFDVARKAERALGHELGDRTLSFLQFGYQGGKEGLLAGEKLYLDLKKMELAYLELNRREYELTKHVSLLQVNPLALIQLRTTGRCTVQLPESLFDMDTPGHYFRRIKTVSVSIPCVVGPYASVNCTLSLLKSSIRTTSQLSDGLYEREGPEDTRFDDHFGSLQSIVTSSAQNDSGLFETNLRDERYLPFEGSGVISEWQLELPGQGNAPRQFDYNSISDVILHIRYTAREGGQPLRGGATSHLNEQLQQASAAGSMRLFSVRHEFPTMWAKFSNGSANADGLFELKLTFSEEHYPFWSKGKLGEVNGQVQALADASKDIEIRYEADGTGEADSLTVKNPKKTGALRTGFLEHFDGAKTTGEFSLFLKNNDLKDLWLIVPWSTKP